MTNDVYLAEWFDDIGASDRCIFSRLDPAIFFVITGLQLSVDWTKFPDPARDERDGSNQDLSPVFIVERPALNGRRVLGTVTKITVADSWTVGVDRAEWGEGAFVSATGRGGVKLSVDHRGLTATVS